jgi:hypothetical protein
MLNQRAIAARADYGIYTVGKYNYKAAPARRSLLLSQLNDLLQQDEELSGLFRQVSTRAFRTSFQSFYFNTIGVG